MTNNNRINISFCGYDVMPLKGIYMQGIKKTAEQRIFKELKNILVKEDVDVFVNTTNEEISKSLAKREADTNKELSIWAQDRKSFIQNKFGKQVLCNNSEPELKQEALGVLKDFEVKYAPNLPRGGDYYIGYKENGDQWIIINKFAISGDNKPIGKYINNLFDIKEENIIELGYFGDDIDEIIRPMGFPYVLVNDYELAKQNVKKMLEKFPNSKTIYKDLMAYINGKRNFERITTTCNDICQKLEAFGFKPIRIASRYHEDINYINAIAFKNKDGKISYITNSTKGSYPELEYLEQIFDKDLKGKIPAVGRTYYVSGGEREQVKQEKQSFLLKSFGFKNRNNIMDILANRLGGIHCMSAEIPKFKTN